ncbi:hypothetical protein MSG28_003465 [Choristoneura fumiferana]|uniref:Uncharacterized protein n=1 Tax=Choristoneura fumiferana TaxID=7141 RepID=A0ACC0KFG5_CHOFU|nr:hypothetical protein MSG28_003465 [Choristoneura fumiferana]
MSHSVTITRTTTTTSGSALFLFYFLISVACLIGTFCLLTACLVSLSTASLISKTVYEVIYHGLAFILYLAAGLTLLIEVNHRKSSYRSQNYEPFLAASRIKYLETRECDELFLIDGAFTRRVARDNSNNYGHFSWKVHCRKPNKF